MRAKGWSRGMGLHSRATWHPQMGFAHSPIPVRGQGCQIRPLADEVLVLTRRLALVWYRTHASAARRACMLNASNGLGICTVVMMCRIAWFASCEPCKPDNSKAYCNTPCRHTANSVKSLELLALQSTWLLKMLGSWRCFRDTAGLSRIGVYLPRWQVKRLKAFVVQCNCFSGFWISVLFLFWALCLLNTRSRNVPSSLLWGLVLFKPLFFLRQA